MTSVSADGRLHAAFVLRSTAEEVEDMAFGISLEQTVEVVPELAQDAHIREGIVGRVESIDDVGPDTFRVDISYDPRIIARSVPQLLNVLFGNVSMMRGVSLRDLEIPAEFGEWLPGPGLGIKGLRRRLGVARRPLVASALKPMGRTPRELAGYAELMAAGGIDLIKDDHGLADHDFCPLEERAAVCVEAIRRGEELSDKRVLYFVNLVCSADELLPSLHRLVELGVDGVMMSPLLMGWDALRLAAGFGELAVMAHPSLSGVFYSAADSGIARPLVLGTIPRLLGADLSIFPSFGGRFGWSPSDCLGIAGELSAGHLPFEPTLPMPAGGLSVDSVAELTTTYGADVAFLVGSNLYVRAADLSKGVREFMDAVKRLDTE